ncbi:MAG: hypothetical protein QNJ72_30880 [Pleurocapsa sp. MO_226.B13]|nr:hypothetical protein [Pleurocapsa sp. MO_226.B13]
MKIFIKYNSAGEILSVSKVKFMPIGTESPFEILDANEFVLEVPLTEELMQIEAVTLHDNYQIDVATKQLIEKT